MFLHNTDYTSLSTHIHMHTHTHKHIHTHTHTHCRTGVGKTTLVRKVCSQLQERHSDIDVRGFCMEEVREGYTWEGTKFPGPKIGFDVVTMSGNRKSLARKDM